MKSKRTGSLIEKLERGLMKSLEIFIALNDRQWNQVIYPEGGWTMRDLLAHFIYSEEHLLDVAKDIAAGGPGAPEELDLDAFNREQLERFEKASPGDLLQQMRDARQATIKWVRGLREGTLDLEGRHPALGIVNLETLLLSIYGHQLLHMREITPQIRNA